MGGRYFGDALSFFCVFSAGVCVIFFERDFIFRIHGKEKVTIRD